MTSVTILVTPEVKKLLDEMAPVVRQGNLILRIRGDFREVTTAIHVRPLTGRNSVNQHHENAMDLSALRRIRANLIGLGIITIR